MINYQKILVPVDFSDVSSTALEKAARHSEASGSRLYVAHIVDRDENIAGVTKESVKDDTIQKIENLLDDSEVGYCEKLVEFGDTIPVLVDIINQYSIDLVVMGTHNFNSLDNHISITRLLGQKIECDILILHNRGGAGC